MVKQIIDGEEVDVPPPGWKPSAGSKYRGVSQQKNEYRAYVTVPSRGMISAGTHATEYAAAKAVAVLSRKLQHELPYTIPDGLVTIPKWVLLTYECPHCKTLMHSDPSDGFCPRYAAHVRECRKGGRFHLEYSGKNTSTSAGQDGPGGSTNVREAPGPLLLRSPAEAHASAGPPPATGCGECGWSEAGCAQCRDRKPACELPLESQHHDEGRMDLSPRRVDQVHPNVKAEPLAGEVRSEGATAAF